MRHRGPLTSCTTLASLLVPSFTFHITSTAFLIKYFKAVVETSDSIERLKSNLWPRMYGEGRPGRHVTSQYSYTFIKKNQNLYTLVVKKTKFVHFGSR